MHGYTKLEYDVSFATPAFLAGADQQQAEWRTPPFKALLREWWRVVKARDVDYQVDLLREAEHRLFGHAAGNEEDSGQSRVRLRLGEWRQGARKDDLHKTLTSKDLKVKLGGFEVYAAVYLGYGPVQSKESDSRPAISNNNDSNSLTVLVRLDESDKDVRMAMQLAAWFGAIGSRSRNSWGSLVIKGGGLQDTSALSASALGKCLRNWTDCLDMDWPHAIGKDQKGPLIWKTTAQFPDWKQALKSIASLRSGVRGLFPLNQHSGALQDRHILAYPIKKPTVNGWGNDARFPNQLRLKIAREGDKYRGILTHVPCALPQQLVRGQTGDLKNKQLRVWSETHKFLDAQSTALTRVS